RRQIKGWSFAMAKQKSERPSMRLPNYQSRKDEFMNCTISLLLTLTAASGAVTLAAAMRTGSPSEKVIRVTAKKFEFLPSEITVKKGEPLVLELTSADRGHGFYLPDFGVEAKIKPEAITRIN